MNDDAAQIRAAVAVLEAQRALIGDALTDAALAPLRARLVFLSAAPREAGRPGEAVLAGPGGVTPSPQASAGTSPVSDPEASPQALRQVTILFVDIADSTAWARQLDAEDMHAVVSTALSCLARVVEAHRGRIARYTGDGMKVIFGADSAHEDDPERAVRCGLALLAQARAHARLLREQHAGLDFQIRVGIHSGLAALGGGFEGKDTVVGGAVHMAARMEQTAPAGGLRISHDTWRLVRGVFDVLAQPPLRVKGVELPLATYLVQGARPRAFRLPARGIEGLETPLVGRGAELQRLRTALQAVCAARRLQAVTVVGDAGLGKSRLLGELLAWVDLQPQPWWLLRGQALPASQTQPYALLRDVLTWRLQIADSDSAALAREKFVAGITPYFADADTPERAAHLLGQLIGLDFSDSPLLSGLLSDARALRDQAFQAAADLLHRVVAADGMPLLVLLDDLHWADEGSLDFLRHLLRDHAELPALLLMLARPQLLERRPDWCEAAATPQQTARQAPHARLDLHALDDGHSQQLAAALLQRVPPILPALPALRALLTGRAQGNPFFMEEIIRVLIDDGVIELAASPAGDGAPPSEVWQVRAERLQATRVPTTLNGVLQARLDALPGAERQALQLASVIGPVFWDQALQVLMPAGRAALPGLLKKGLLVRGESSAFEDATEYRFQHALLQQVAYGTVLKAPRRAAHAGIASWLRLRLGERADEVLAMVADHLERAGDDAQALDCFERAASAAVARYAQASALAHLERALANPRLTDPQQRWRLLARATVVADTLGDTERQSAYIEARVPIAEKLADPGLHGEIMFDRSLLADRRGEVDTALARSQSLADFAVQHGLARHAALALANVAWQRASMGGLPAARDSADTALAWAARQPDAKVRAQVALVAYAVEDQCGDLARQEARLREAREWAQKLTGEPRLQSSVLEGSTILALNLGDAAQALESARAALSLTEANAMLSRLPGVLCNLSQACQLHGELHEALAHSSRALALLQREPETLNTYCPVLLQNASVLAALRRHDEAHAHLARALAVREAQGHGVGVREALAQMAVNHLEAGHADAAGRCVDRILAADDGTALPAAELETLMQCHQVLSALHDRRAGGLLERASREVEVQLGRVADAAQRARLQDCVPTFKAVARARAAGGPETGSS